MARGGYRVGAGRPKTIIERPNEGFPAAEHDADHPVTPLEYMLRVLNDKTAAASRRDRMAIAAAPFSHPRVEPRLAGKKDKAIAAARTAGVGTEWGNDLTRQLLVAGGGLNGVRVGGDSGRPAIS